EVREVDVSYSVAQNTLEEKTGKYCAVRLGFRQIDGFSWADQDEERLKRQQALFRNHVSPTSFRGGPQGRAPNPYPTALAACRIRVEQENARLAVFGLREWPKDQARPVVMDSGPAPYGASRNDDGEDVPIPRNDNDIPLDDWAARIVAARKRRPFTSL